MMAYMVPYEADYRCPKGHAFTATAHPFKKSHPLCPVCYEAWIAANVPLAEQISDARMVKTGVTYA